MRKHANRLFAGVLAVIMVITALPMSAFATETDTATEIVEISTFSELQSFANAVNGGTSYEGKEVVLTANIDLGGETNPWTPIGDSKNPFKGTFNGNYHVISGLSIASGSNNGFFGYVDSGLVKNIVVQGSVSGSSYAAGIVGYLNNGTVQNCGNEAAVSGVSGVGGVVGYVKGSSTVSGCYNKGDITGTTGYIGGVTGWSGSAGVVVENCYNIGTVSGPSTVGGVSGGFKGYETTLKNCFHAGELVVTSPSFGSSANYGPILGAKGSCENCYYTKETSTDKDFGTLTDKLSAELLGEAFVDDDSTGLLMLAWEADICSDKAQLPAFVESTKLSTELASYIEEAVNSAKMQKSLSAAETLLGNADYMAGASSTDTDWMALAMGRFGYFDADGSYSFKIDDKEGYTSYLEAMKTYIEKTYQDNEGILHSAKATEWHRAVVAIAALGGDPANFGTYSGQPINLIADGSYNNVLRNGPGTQGINGWIWGLIALDSGNYEVPADAKYTRETFIKEILKMQLTDGVNGNEYGGWVLGGYGSNSDVDITAMAIQALAPYYNDDTVYTYTNENSGEEVSKTVRQCVDEALERLGSMLSGNGGFTSWGTNNVESIAQVIVALCSLGINPAKDTRFITANGKTLLDGMLAFRLSDGGFCHVIGSPWNSMANDQATYALVSYWRLENGMRALYDMRSDWTEEEKNAIQLAVKTIEELPDPSEKDYKAKLKSALAVFRAVPEQERRYVGNYAQLAAAIELVGGEEELDTDTPYITSISVTANPNKLKYFEGDAFEPEGMVVTAVYSDNTQKAINGYLYSPAGVLTCDNTKIYITYGVLKTTLGITVSEKMPWEGEGTEENPYLIQTADDLTDLYQYTASKKIETLGVHFKMTQDINMKNIENWRGIADTITQGFQGHFDGNGHAIWNLTCKVYNATGLFGKLGNEAVIENLTIASGQIGGTDQYSLGGIAGELISNATATIRNCHNYAALSGTWGVGGILGEVEDKACAIIEDCSNHGTIAAAYTGGGIIGQVGPNRWGNNGSSASITNCYNTGDIGGTGSWGIGGIVGSFRLGGTDTSLLQNCYNAGKVQETESSGAILGSVCEQDTCKTGVTIENVYYLDSCNSKAYGVFDDGGSDTSGTITGTMISKTENEMKTDSFVEMLKEAFALDGQSVNNGYPILKQQKPLGEEAPVRAGLEIGTQEELVAFAARVNQGESFTGKTVALTSHLDFSDMEDWTPIGSSSACMFDGTFDGQNYVIDNLYSVKGGLFGYVGDNAVIKNVGVASGKIGNEGNEIQWLGGIANWSNGADFINCWNGADIYCSGYSGGIVGTVRNGGESLIQNCYNTGSIYATATHVGGIIGHLDTSREQEKTEVHVTIQNCYNTGEIYARSAVGGIAGLIQDGHTIQNCYNAGSIAASSETSPEAGAIVGAATSKNTFQKCYYDTAICETGIGNRENEEVIGMTTEAMCSEDFVTLLGESFMKDSYGLANGGYPIFTWQRTYDADDIDEVAAKISAIGEVTLDSSNAIDEARNAYDNLDDELKSYVYNYALLEQAEESITAMQTLQQEKVSAKNELDAYKKLSDYCPAQQEELTQLINDGKAAIDSAVNVTLVNEALGEAKNKMDSVKTAQQLTDEESNKDDIINDKNPSGKDDTISDKNPSDKDNTTNNDNSSDKDNTTNDDNPSDKDDTTNKSDSSDKDSISNKDDKSDHNNLSGKKGTLKLSRTSVVLYTGKVSGSAVVKVTSITGASKTVKWTSKNPKIAKVVNGKITAVKAGKTTITCTANGISQTVKVTVKNPSLTIKKGKKKFTKKKLTVKKKKSVKLTVSVTPAKSGISLSKLSNKNKKIASVQLKNGKLIIKGKKNGKFTITLKSGKAVRKLQVTVK